MLTGPLTLIYKAKGHYLQARAFCESDLDSLKFGWSSQTPEYLARLSPIHSFPALASFLDGHTSLWMDAKPNADSPRQRLFHALVYSWVTDLWTRNSPNSHRIASVEGRSPPY